MRRFSALVLMVWLLPSLARSEPFDPACTLPFDALAERHPIDDACDADGRGTTAKQKAQNRAKNSFCAHGTPVRITFRDFVPLQQSTDNAGLRGLQDDRSVLENIRRTSDGKRIGEGTLVRLSAYVVDAHYSNVSKGEAVNCKRPGQENNDIHIALARTSSEEDLCNTVTAEISPHFRPITWQPDHLNALGRHPVRLSGQLFFDGSHRPCVNGRGSPRRASVWEIHPIYSVDVCRNESLQSCDASDESKWVPLEEWLNLEDEPEDE